jgi:hypothetical protein
MTALRADRAADAGHTAPCQQQGQYEQSGAQHNGAPLDVSVYLLYVWGPVSMLSMGPTTWRYDIAISRLGFQ